MKTLQWTKPHKAAYGWSDDIFANTPIGAILIYWVLNDGEDNFSTKYHVVLHWPVDTELCDTLEGAKQFAETSWKDLMTELIEFGVGFPP
jgi:hypothetical protein